ncbi:MAG: hypothetical protein GXP54_04585 [Deltaproteobacteria bacterium]|nr:hypothetical protein [Deltaproteobacteria bacterium]
MKTGGMFILLVSASMASASCGSGGGGKDAEIDPGQDIQTDIQQDLQQDLADTGLDQSMDQGIDEGVAPPPDAADGEAMIKDLPVKDLPVDVIDDEGPIQDTGNDTQVVNFGFDVRVPQEHTVPCDDNPFGPKELVTWDQDWICTFDYDGTSGYVYVQSTPTGCFVTMGANPVYQSPGAWMSIDGTVTPIDGAYYDWGGNHHNDWLEFNHDGNHFKFYHSSFGVGWRKCQDMDCFQVYDATGATLQKDGCAKDRALPATCVLVEHDGTVPEFADVSQLPSDQWPCPGDPNYR